MLVFIPVALALRSMFADTYPTELRPSHSFVIARLLTLHAALFTLWFIGVQSVMLLVFLVMFIGWLTAYRWPTAERSLTDELQRQHRLCDGGVPRRAPNAATSGELTRRVA